MTPTAFLLRRAALAHGKPALLVIGLAAVLLAPPGAVAQTPPKAQTPVEARTSADVQTPADAEMSAEAEPALEWLPLRVGDATQGLLALQREGTHASTTPRPIPGEIAHRSYERYLNSFNHPIPEKYGSTVTVKGGSK